ncbi:glycosyltransferase, partial [Plantactinospora sp. KLBMP9567]
LGVSHAVDYQPVYHEESALGRLIRSADAVVLPYDSREQVTSGVLVAAVAAGVPVVATPFPHAVELLTDGPGLLVPHEDPAALAAAIRRILTEPGLASSLADRTRTRSSTLRWPAVAARYHALAERLLTDRVRAGGSPAVTAAPA